jgi:drug/metabolite transporter (DMT)-like permease
VLAVTSVLLGAGAALTWASASLLGARAAGHTAPAVFALQFTLFACVWAAIPGGLALAADPPASSDLIALAGAGLSNTVGVIFLGHALGRGQITVVGPLVALEGVVAACLAFAFGGQLGQLAAVGVAITAIGITVVGVAAAARGRAAGGLSAVAAAACFGVTLWCFAIQDAPAIGAYLLMRVAGLIALVAIALAVRSAPHFRVSYALVGMAACDFAGNILYLVGTRVGSPIATAVVAAQFGTLVALWGLMRLRQPVGPAQLAGIAILAIGIAAVAAGSG